LKKGSGILRKEERGERSGEKHKPSGISIRFSEGEFYILSTVESKKNERK